MALVKASDFKGKDVLSMRDYNREDIDFILDEATKMVHEVVASTAPGTA